MCKHTLFSSLETFAKEDEMIMMPDILRRVRGPWKSLMCVLLHWQQIAERDSFAARFSTVLQKLFFHFMKFAFLHPGKISVPKVPHGNSPQAQNVEQSRGKLRIFISSTLIRKYLFSPLLFSRVFDLALPLFLVLFWENRRHQSGPLISGAVKGEREGPSFSPTGGKEKSPFRKVALAHCPFVRCASNVRLSHDSRLPGKPSFTLDCPERCFFFCKFRNKLL